MPQQATSSLLDNVRIASPCFADWKQMKGDASVRFCGRCQLNVYNISEMNLQEAEQLIKGKEGKLCTRYFRRLDGTILTKDCPIGIRALERVRRGICLVLAGIASILFGIQTKQFVQSLMCTPFQGT